MPPEASGFNEKFPSARNKSVKILFASSSFVSIPIIDTLLESREVLEKDHQIEFSGILSNPDTQSGRGRNESANEIVARYRDQIDIFQPASHHELFDLISEISPDLVITCAYGRLIKKKSLELPTNGWLNLHFSILPRWRGAAPVQWGLISGDSEFGFTIFQLDEGMDTGPILYQEKVSISDQETRDEVLLSISRSAIEPLIRTIIDLPRLTPQPQSTVGVTLAPKVTKEMGKVEWDLSAHEIFNRYRGLTPDPGIFTFYDEQRIVITDLALVSPPEMPESVHPLIAELQPGEFTYLTKSASDGIVKCGSEILCIKRVKPAGKKEMTFGDFLRGVRITPLEKRKFS
jgi:methionyl-tRNA formyltransferase